jgi:hypothetical protein
LFSDLSENAPTHSISVNYSSNYAGEQWRGNTTISGNSTWVNSGISAVANTWYNLKMVINADATNVDFYLNGSLFGSSTTNIPYGPVCRMAPAIKIVKDNGASGNAMYVDAVYVKQSFAVPR